MHRPIVLFTLLAAFYDADGNSMEPNPQNPLWADEGRLGRYQDAWRSIDQNSSAVYYLAKATYENDTGSWGQKFRCLSVKETERNVTEKTVHSVFVFKNASSEGNQTFTVVEKVKAIKAYGYSKENAIKYLLEDPKVNLTDPLVFTDGLTCDFFHVPYANNGAGGFELWVNAEFIDNIPQCCMFLLNYFRGSGSEVYDIYDKQLCSAVPRAGTVQQEVQKSQ